MTKKSHLSEYETWLNPTIRPQDDFYHHVNGKWLAEHPIPASETVWGTFNVLHTEAQEAMRDIYENLQDGQFAPGSIQQQARDFYYTGMHYDELETASLQLLQEWCDKIDGIATTSELSRMVGELHAIEVMSPWTVIIDNNQADSSQHIFCFHQGGLTLPNRDYYLDDSAKMRDVRQKYRQHIDEVLARLPHLGNATFTDAVIDFETEIATISRTSADLRDVEGNYHKTTYADLQQTYANIDWPAYAAGHGWRPDDKISVNQPEFMAFINDSFALYPLDTWKIYLKWRLTVQCLGKVSSEFTQLQFDFFGRILGGAKELQPLWKRTVRVVDGAIGNATGRLYTEKHFPESSKKQVLDIVENIRAAYHERIGQLDWMGDKTKRYAQKKLANMKVLIGYPDEWRDYSSLVIGRKSHLANALAVQKFESAYWLGKLHQPTSREEWFMTPQTVNAYNDPARLVICFPAAILQQPFFDPSAHIAANMGGIGMVIGHELSHGFDDQGCQFDAEGNVKTWQTKKERDAFAKKAKVIINQADAFEVLPGLNLKGDLVIGESIADLGGVEIAFHALKQRLGKDIDTNAAGALSAVQLFFVNYARGQCSAVREERLRELTLIDWHPVSEFRVNEILRHVDGFYLAFNVHDDDRLFVVEEKRVKIW